MEFKAFNESEIIVNDNEIRIYATEKSDFFMPSTTDCEDGILPQVLSNAPYYYVEVEGDFVLTVNVMHQFKDVYDSASIMIYDSETVWAKSCFELTDFNTHAVVSVVTNGYSDDANGVNIDSNSLYLKVCRVGNGFSFLYSIDGIHYFMSRYFTLPVGRCVKVGMLAQCPTGDGGYRYYRDFKIENATVGNIREGK